MELADDMVEDGSNPKDRWYKEDNDQQETTKEFDHCPAIPVSKEEFEEWCKPWKKALIVKLLDKRVGLAFMERLKRDWVRKGTINVIDMDRDYFLVHFSDDEDYSHALMEGPWMIAGYYLIVQRWRPFFLTSENVVRKIVVWVHIPNLPIELYNQRFLWRVGSTIVHMLKIDRATSIHSREKFVRICVKIDLTKKLVPRISVLGSELNIEYEGLHQISFSCCKYSHRSESCYDNLETKASTHQANFSDDENSDKRNTINGEGDQNGKNNEGINVRDASTNATSNFGPWMLVKRPIRRKKDISFQKKKKRVLLMSVISWQI
ncbi:hypothetical protein Ahy_B02g058354 [Arachis hypogaea]|uniref:DUF4283 domain-containing protein n=1 Tax=Arachis hypogaea TaxID=3818 RepID=A0A445AEG7_ARAHY|nr:hypothetical protein Ahy_B02g058354 [Arachis hypogaea]